MLVQDVSDLAIERLLYELGYDKPAAALAARTVLESAGLTRPGKTYIASAKRSRVVAALSAALARSCGEPDCAHELEGTGLPVLEVTPRSCERCGGSAVRRSAIRLAAACRAHGGCRVVVLGGSPRTREEIDALAVRGLEVRLVDGTARRTIDVARADARWADVVVVWASTELDHKVSKLYAEVANGRLLTVSRRGVAALLDALADRLRGRASAGPDDRRA